MADNLKLQQDINKLIAERNKMLEEGEALIQRQAKIYATLLEVMAGKKGAEAIDEMIGKLNSAKEAMAQMAKGAEDASKMSGQAFDITGQDVDKLFGKTKTLTEHMQTKFPKAFVVGAAALSGLRQGFKNVIALGQGLFGVFESLVGGAFNVGKAILAIPFKIFGGLIEKAQAGGGGQELMQAYEDVRKEFGSFKEDVAKNVIDAAKSMQGELAETGLSTWRVLGNMAERLKFVTELAKGMGATFHVLGLEVAQNAERLVAYQKGLGISAEEMQGVSQRAIAMGTTLTGQLQDIANMSLQMGKSFGLSSKLLSRDVGRMIKDVKNFGSLSVKEMTEVSVYTRKLGFEFTKLQGLIDKFDTFEGAAESAAKLSQAFGVNVNAFEMMKKQNPAERMDELRKAFTLAGKSAENLSRQELKLIEDATGLDAETAKLALSSKNAGLSMDEIKKKSDAASKKQLTQTEVMNKLADAIERMVHAGGPQGITGFFDAFLKGILQGIQSSPEFIKLMYDIRRAIMQVFQQGVELGRWLVKNFPGVLDMFHGLHAALKPIPVFFKTLSENIKQFVSGGLSLEQFVGNMREAFHVFLDSERGPFSSILVGFRTFMKKMAAVTGEGIRFLVKKLTEGLREATTFLKDPKKYLDQALAGGKAGSNFIMELLQPLIEAVKDPKMWEDLWDAFKGFAGEFWNQMKKVFNFIMGKIPASFWVGVAGLFFGPMVSRTFLSVGGIVLGESLRAMFSNVAKSVPDIAEKAASGAASAGGALTRFLGPLLGNPYVIAAAAVAALSVVGAGMSKGVEKFKKDVEKEVGKGDEALFGAATAGIIQTLSFGTISDEAASMIGVNLAKIAKQAEKFMADIFGQTFADDLKEIFFSSMRSVIDLGDLVRSIFKGDAKGVIKAIGALSADLLELLVSGIKLVFVTLPLKIAGLISDLAGSLGDILGDLFDDSPAGKKLTDELFANFGTWIDNFGSYLVKGLIDAFDIILTKVVPGITKFVMGIGAFLIKGLGALVGQLSAAIAHFFGPENWLTGILEKVREFLFDFGHAFSFTGKFLADASKKLWEQVKNVLSGKEANFTDVFLSFGDPHKEFEKYKKSLKTQTQQAVEAKKEAIDTVNSAQPPAPPPGPQDVSSFFSKASQTAEGIDTLKKSLVKIDEKDLQKMKESFSKVVAVFGEDKDLAANVEKVTKVNEAFSALSGIASSAASFKQNFEKVGDITVPLQSMSKMVQASADIASKFPTIKGDDLDKIVAVRKHFAELAGIKESADSLVKTITSGGIDKSFKAVVDMVKKVQDMNDAVTNMTNKPLEIKARLQELATRLGLGANQTYSIKNNGIEIKLDLNVTMEAGKVEEVIVRRTDSRIRKAFSDTGLKDVQSLNSHLGAPY